MTQAVVERIDYKLDINTLDRDTTATQFALNDIGGARFKLQKPLVVDAYSDIRATGGFIIIDETSPRTVGAAMIIDAG